MAYSDVVGPNQTIYMTFNNNSLSVNNGLRSITTSLNSVTWGTGIAGSAPVFNGTSTYIRWTVGGGNDLFNNNLWFTGIWFKKAVANSTGYQELINTFDTNNSVLLYASQGDGAVALWYNFAGAAKQKIVGPVINDTNWHYLAAASTGNGGSVKLYLDGIEVGTPGTVGTGTFTTGTYIWQGAYGNGAGNENFAGMMDEFEVLRASAPAPTAIRNRYEQGLGIVSTSYTAQVGSATALLVNPTVSTITNVAPSAQPLTAGVSMPDPVTSTARTVSASGQPLVASAAMPTATVSTQTFKSANVTAEPFNVSAALSEHNGFAVAREVTASPMTAQIDIVSVQPVTTRGVAYTATSATATAALKQPAAVNGQPILVTESEDDYFQRVMKDKPSAWLRLNDLGSLARDRMSRTSGTYEGVVVGQHNGPDGRASVYFNGNARLSQNEPGGPDEITQFDGRSLETTLEFSFRTNKANSFLMGGSDYAVHTNPPLQSSQPAREIFLQDGKIGFRTYFFPNSLGTFIAPKEFTGFNNLADGQWHHIVIKGQNVRFGEYGVEIWVDGKFEVRRTSAGAFTGFPDFIGTRPSYFGQMQSYQEIGALPSSLNYVGDMSEIAFYSHFVDDNDIPRHYYSFMGWKPFEAQPAEAFAFATAGNAGRGNQKRALYLWWSRYETAYNTGGGSYIEGPNTNAMLGGKGNYDAAFDYEGYKVFTRNVWSGPKGPYRSVVTDAPQFIDLEHDVDLDDYDVILFGDWPDKGTDIDDAEAFEPGGRARLIKQLRAANDRGIGLFITQPRLATDLGIVDRIEWVPNLRESKFSRGQGAAMDLYDYGSAYKFPWNIVADAGLNTTVVGSTFNGKPVNRDPAFLAQKAYFYGDSNKNDRFRVRALIDGLTDIPSYMVEDAICYREYDEWGWGDDAFKYLHRLDGLRLGDEFLYHGSDFGKNAEAASQDFNIIRFGRWFGTYATPLANVKAGTVVTTFGSTLWQEQQQVANPYKDYATCIVLRPGDVLNGKPVGGRIFVNYSESPNRRPGSVIIQKLPEKDSDFPRGYNPDTPEQRLWEWSMTRRTQQSTQVQSSTNVQIIGPTGGVIDVALSGGGGTLAMTRSKEIFPIEYQDYYPMVFRGLQWLKGTDTAEPGSVIAVAKPMTANAAAGQSVAIAQRDGVVKAQSLSALAAMPKVKEDKSGDAQINTLPMTATALITGYGKTFTAAPMTATAEVVENFDAVYASGEQIVLTLNSRNVILYMEET